MATRLWSYFPVIIREHRERNFQFESASFNSRVHRFSIQEHSFQFESTQNPSCVLSTLYSRFQMLALKHTPAHSQNVLCGQNLSLRLRICVRLRNLPENP